jgi:hypothetical protein
VLSLTSLRSASALLPTAELAVAALPLPAPTPGETASLSAEVPGFYPHPDPFG